MKLAIPVVALALANCGYTPGPTGALTDSTSSAASSSQAIRAEFARQIQTWNAAGLDPIRILDDPLLRTYALVGCSALTSLSSVINPGAVTLGDETGPWCLTLTQALSSATATAAPAPAIPSPAGS